jgi:hypothetical protein
MIISFLLIYCIESTLYTNAVKIRLLAAIQRYKNWINLL